MNQIYGNRNKPWKLVMTLPNYVSAQNPDMESTGLSTPQTYY